MVVICVWCGWDICDIDVVFVLYLDMGRLLVLVVDWWYWCSVCYVVFERRCCWCG